MSGAARRGRQTGAPAAEQRLVCVSAHVTSILCAQARVCVCARAVSGQIRCVRTERGKGAVIARLGSSSRVKRPQPGRTAPSRPALEGPSWPKAVSQRTCPRGRPITCSAASRTVSAAPRCLEAEPGPQRRRSRPSSHYGAYHRSILALAVVADLLLGLTHRLRFILGAWVQEKHRTSRARYSRGVEHPGESQRTPAEEATLLLPRWEALWASRSETSPGQRKPNAETQEDKKYNK